MQCKLDSLYLSMYMELVLHYGSGMINLSLCKRWSLIRQWEWMCMLPWTLQLTESLASLFDRWIVKLPPLRIEREFVESRIILLAVLKWRTSCSCQDSSHYQPFFCPASHLLSITTRQSGLGFVGMRLQSTAISNFVGGKKIRDILLTIFFIFEAESERVEVRRVETRGMETWAPISLP
jgi:hypothetical protein